MRRAAPLLAILVAACASGPAQPSSTERVAPSAPVGPTAPATAASSPGSSDDPSFAIGPAVSLALDAAGPIIASDAGPAGHQFVLPAAAARDRDGGFVLFIVWFGSAPGDQIVTVARSDDGRTWRIGNEAILTDLGMDLVRPMAIPSAAVQLDDGTWLLYGWAAHASSPTTFTTWRAHAAKPEGPWTLDAPTVLDVGVAGSWDSQTAAAGAVRRDGAGFVTWYEGQGPGTSARGEIGYATSTDGLRWQKAPEPVIRHGVCGAGTSVAITQPQIESWSGGFGGAILGTGSSDDRGAVYGVTSTDGRSWVCGSATPILRAADIPGSQGIHTIASVPLDDGRFELIIESLAGDRSELWSAVVEVGG